MYLTGMTFVLAQKIELQDRARLRERFYGAARTVWRAYKAAAQPKASYSNTERERTHVPQNTL